MICNVKDPCFLLMIITTYKIIVAVKGHIGSRDRDVLVSGNIDSFTIIMLVVSTCGNWKGRDIPFPMIHDSMDIRRENGLGMFIRNYSRICPPEEGLREFGGVVQLSCNFHICLVWIEGDKGNCFCPIHAIAVIEENARTSIWIMSDFVINVHKSCWAVVLRPIELNTSADPRTKKAH